VSGSPVAALDRRSWASAKRDLCENFAGSANFSKLQMILYFNCNYSLNILNWQKQDVAHWFGCAEETKFQRRVFENILVKWRVQIPRRIICPKLYNYIITFKTVQNLKYTFHSFPLRLTRIN
jgi:hypothetical protein